MAIHLQALKTEFETNPVSMAYPAFTAINDAANADVINNAGGSNPRTVNNDTVEISEVKAATTNAAFTGLVSAQEAYWVWLTDSPQIHVNDETLQQLAGVPIVNGSIWSSGNCK